MNPKPHFDVIIIGSGFAGSILATILARNDLRVALIDRQEHPRFALGESSTPIADELLRQLGLKHAVPEWVTMSRYGDWKKHHRDLVCGIKRGFTYFLDRGTHQDPSHLWAAASPMDSSSDTHWLRSDVDQYLYQLAIQAGASSWIGYEVVGLQEEASSWTVDTIDVAQGSSHHLTAQYLIDASGSSAVTAKLLGCPNHADQLATKTSSTFGHYIGVRNYSEFLESRGIDSQNPFDADAAAQHHLINDGSGWVWMLRFDNGVTSVGTSVPVDAELDLRQSNALKWMMASAELVTGPGIDWQFQPSRQAAQRLHDPVIGSRGYRVPTAALTLDPLHSTGIAHGLSGVDRIANHILGSGEECDWVEAYRGHFESEVRLLDQLVSTAYRVMPDFERFSHACQLYFLAAIGCEEALQRRDPVGALWMADDEDFVSQLNVACNELVSRSASPWPGETDFFERFEAWNSAGLFDPAAGNRFAYTATK